MASAARTPSNEDIFRADMVKLLAESDGFNAAPVTLADIPFPKGRSYDAAEAFIRQYEGILKAGVDEKLPNKELAIRITTAYAETLGRVAYDGAAGGDAVKAAAVRKWSRDFFGKALITKDAAAQKRIDELMNRDLLDSSLPSRLNLLAQLALLPFAWTIKKFQDVKLDREVRDRLAKMRPVNKLETASKHLNRSTIALSYALDEYINIGGYVTADKEVQIHPIGKDGKFSQTAKTVQRDSDELRAHVAAVQARITKLSTEYDEQLKVFKDSFGTLKGAGDLGLVSAGTVEHMKSTALLQESRGRSEKTKKESLRQLVPEFGAKVAVMEAAGFASPEFAQLARRKMQAQFDANLREELREYAREASHAVLQENMERAQRAIIRATDERRGFNPIEKMSIQTAIGDGSKLSGQLASLYEDHSGADVWSEGARLREQKRLEESQEAMAKLMKQAEESKFLSEIGGKETKELLEKLKDFEPSKALSKLVDMMKRFIVGPQQQQQQQAPSPT